MFLCSIMQKNCCFHISNISWARCAAIYHSYDYVSRCYCPNFTAKGSLPQIFLRGKVYKVLKSHILRKVFVGTSAKLVASIDNQNCTLLNYKLILCYGMYQGLLKTRIVIYEMQIKKCRFKSAIEVQQTNQPS